VSDHDASSEALYVWLGLETKKGLSVSGAVVTEKVMQLHSHYIGRGREEQASLCASKSWFAKFKKCVSVHSTKRTGELHLIAMWLALNTQSISERCERDCLPQQVFTLDRTGLFWKKITLHTFISKNENISLGFQV
jgi:hypothetical protein